MKSKSIQVLQIMAFNPQIGEYAYEDFMLFQDLTKDQFLKEYVKHQSEGKVFWLVMREIITIDRVIYP